MRVLFPFVGDSYGGSHVSALSLIQALKDEHSISPVIGLHREGYFSSVLDQFGIDWVLLPQVTYVQNYGLARQLMQVASCSLPLGRFLKDHKIDIVHTNDLRMHLSWLLASKLARVVHVWHQRGPASSLRASIYMACPSAIFTISHYCRAFLPRYVRNRAIIIDNPVSFSSRVTEVVEYGDGFPEEACGALPSKILFVGNWIERKKPLTFVRAAKHVLEHCSQQIMFTMVGEEREPLRTTVRDEIRKLGLCSNFNLVGAQLDVKHWYETADLVVAPAVNEGLGRTLIEASILGVPVIASRDGGHLEILRDGETCTFFEPNDSYDLADKIINFLCDQDAAKRMALVAQRDCLERFSPSTHAKRVVSSYAILLQKKN